MVRLIAKSLQEFAGVLQNLEDERTRMEAKKKYDKETEKYCAVLDKHLSLSAKKKESQLHEADSQVDNVRQHFYEVSLEYVFKVQEVQERKMFDFVEPTRNRFESTRSEVESLMRKMKENPHEHKSMSQHVMEGYLFILEKRPFVSSWVKYYCTYHREPKKMTMVLFDQKSGGRVVYNLNRDLQSEGGKAPPLCLSLTTQLDVIGFNVIKKFIYALETRARGGGGGGGGEVIGKLRTRMRRKREERSEEETEEEKREGEGGGKERRSHFLESARDPPQTPLDPNAMNNRMSNKTVVERRNPGGGADRV
ncbi:hypothetical protein CRUP_007811 [Coryphaenoides rupestris]|nr:hypothetical protein CRUP_007811 [Coryphaenoides rupestris]